MESNEEGDGEEGNHRDVQDAPDVGLTRVGPDSEAGDEGDDAGDEDVGGESVCLV